MKFAVYMKTQFLLAVLLCRQQGAVLLLLRCCSGTLGIISTNRSRTHLTFSSSVMQSICGFWSCKQLRHLVNVFVCPQRTNAKSTFYE